MTFLSTLFIFKYTSLRTIAMAHWLRALALFRSGSVPSLPDGSHICNSSSRGYDAFF